MHPCTGNQHNITFQNLQIKEKLTINSRKKLQKKYVHSVPLKSVSLYFGNKECLILEK